VGLGDDISLGIAFELNQFLPYALASYNLSEPWLNYVQT
jgi:hypothetical protein